MKETKSLPEELHKPLDEARQILKLSQTEIARRAGLPQATVSNLLRGQAIQKKSILAILNVLTEVLGEKRTQGGLSDDEAARLQQNIQRAYTFCAAGSGPVTFRAHPGGGMPPNAANRLERTALWSEMEEALRDHPFSMAVDGPPQSGKTTLLLQLAETARREKFAVAFFDCIIVPEGQPSSVLFSGLARTLASEWGLELPANPPNDTFSFTQWLLAKRRAQPEPRGLLILDQVTDLEMDRINELESVIRVLHNQRGGLNVSFVLGRCPKSSACADWILKSKGYFHPIVNVGWFGKKEVQKLVELHPDCPQLPEIADRLFAEFRGQPYVTHAAIARLSRPSSDDSNVLLSQVLEEARQFEGSFGKFLVQMEHVLFAGRVEASGQSQNLTTEQRRELLHSLNLIQEDNQPSSKFYKELLSKLSLEREGKS